MSTLQDPTPWKLRSGDEFAQFCRNELAPCLIACEQERQRAARNTTTTWIVAAVLGVIAGLLILGSGGPPPALLFVLIAAVGISVAGGAIATSRFRKRFKSELISQVVRFFGPDFTFDPHAGIPQGRFVQSLLFQRGIDRYQGEDLICGTAGKTRFEFSEVHAEYRTTTTDSKGRRHTQWHTIFKGLFFIADFNKHFNGVTLVLPDVAEASLGWFGQKLQEMNFSRPGDLVKLEDPDFEKLFVVYGTDQVEARYILSPALMQRLIDFRRKVGRSIHLSFKDGSVFIAVDVGRNLLEPKLFSPINAESCREVFADLCFALSIIEDLNLNTRIWSKQ